MALTVQLIKRSGSTSARGYKITEVYGVRDDAASECNLGPINIMAHADIPKFGAVYAPAGGCDTGHAGVFVESVEVSEPYNDGKYCSCTVTVVYGQPDEQLPQGYKPHPQHNTSDDPVDWKPELEIRKQPRTVERRDRLFLGAHTLGSETLSAVTNGVVDMQINATTPLTTTAGEPFEPPHTEEVYDQIITIGIYTATWDQNVVYKTYEGAVNNADLRIKIDEWNYDRTFAKHSIKMGPITGRPGFRKWKDNAGAEHSRTYWLTQFELHFRNDLWYLDYHNAGTQRVYRDSAQSIPDGIGGTRAAADFPDGTMPTGPISDANNIAANVPVPLLKDGQPNLDKTTRWLLRWLDGHEKNFSATTLGLPTATP